MTGKAIFCGSSRKSGTKFFTARFFAVPPMKREAAIKREAPDPTPPHASPFFNHQFHS
ncbi:hypothetical protein QE408_002975 [Agrobacterium larrymoorei]|uniref:Propionyl-coenzyme A carboxylase alpha polypeptide n=1 Tax=Agrobacterium larrymoorei TaxID=160699 RepID=A0ABU0ULK4_9HYPH|nr:hypothetical protein [Agrobacterium larrymoorei]